MYISPNFQEIYLIDVNPLTELTSCCLFEFSELNHLVNDACSSILFKFIEKNEDTIIGLCERNFLPVDLLNSGSDITGIDFNNLPSQ